MSSLQARPALLFCTLAALPCLPAPAQAPAEIRREIVAGTNAFRKKNELPPLKVDPTLAAIAQKHCENMARQDKYGDDDMNGHVLDGKSPRDRILDGHYAFARFAENVAWTKGQDDPAGAVVRGWVDSPPHRKNMLLADVTEIGVGAAQGRSGRWYYCQLFGQPGPGPGDGSKIDLSIQNTTGEKVVVRLSLNKEKYDIGPGVTFSMTVNGLAKVRFDLLDAQGEPAAAIEAVQGQENRFRITAKEGKYAVEQQK